MPNSIALAKNYTSLLDEVYKAASVTNDLVSPAEVIREGSQANTIVYPQISMNGLADYSRNSGYVNNAVTVEWKEAAFNYDRGTKISVDQMDNEETRNIAFARAGGELMRVHVAPESDAFTFAQIAGTTGIGAASGTLSAGADVLSALYTGTVAMDEAEVPTEGRILYITPTLHKTVDMLDTTKSREILGYFSKVVDVPQSRFYTAITLGENGYAKADNKQSFTATTSQTDFTVTAKPAALQKVTVDGEAVTTGWTYTASTGVLAFTAAPGNNKAVVAIYDSGTDMNFMIVEPSALIKFDKHVVSDIIPAAMNPSADADILKYRKYGIVQVYGNKVAGIYAHYKAI